MSEYVWKDRKRTVFGLPWSFTRYCLQEEKLIIDTGFFSRSEEEIRLYRITDISLKRTLGERIFGLGTIHCCSGDKTSPEFDIKRIKNPKDVKEMLSDMVEEERLRRRVTVRENFIDDDHDEDSDFDRVEDGDE
ncbi:MAG: PH domain-containing protein [Clostridia bacterium]|nr:PH domain-containing protein [Clostridia bacterium]